MCGGELEIVVGNVIGSNILNLLLVLVFFVLIKLILSYDKSVIWDVLVMLIVLVVFVWLVYIGEIFWWGGFGFVMLFVVYLILFY